MKPAQSRGVSGVIAEIAAADEPRCVVANLAPQAFGGIVVPGAGGAVGPGRAGPHTPSLSHPTGWAR